MYKVNIALQQKNIEEAMFLEFTENVPSMWKPASVEKIEAKYVDKTDWKLICKMTEKKYITNNIVSRSAEDEFDNCENKMFRE